MELEMTTKIVLFERKISKLQASTPLTKAHESKQSATLKINLTLKTTYRQFTPDGTHVPAFQLMVNETDTIKQLAKAIAEVRHGKYSLTETVSI